MTDITSPRARGLTMQECIEEQRSHVAALAPGTLEHRIADEVLSLLIEGQRLREDVDRLLVDRWPNDAI